MSDQATPFPSAETVFGGDEGAYFVPLLSLPLDTLLPGGVGLVHFLRPKMLAHDLDQSACKLGDNAYPAYWYPFRRESDWRYHTKFRLAGTPAIEGHAPFSTLHNGDAKEGFEVGEIGWNDLLSCSEAAGEWPNANWNDGKSAESILGRPLRFLGEIDATNFCRIDCGSVLVLDIQKDEIIQIFHWT